MSGPSMSRRRLLSAAGLLGAACVGGCRFDPEPPAAIRSSATPAPDAALLGAAHAELTTLITRLTASNGMADLVACHRAQLTALGAEQPPVTRRSRPLTPTAVVTRERQAVTRFSHWALTCTDGDLARVLASVAAGIRMQPELQGAA